MLYVIQVETGKEEETRDIIRMRINCFREVFCVKQEKFIRKQGEYRLVTANVFPGYLFIETDNPDELFLQLKNVDGITILLSDKNKSGYNFISLTEREEALIRYMINDDPEYIVRTSKVDYDDDNMLCNIDGPLSNFMDCLAEVDRRHRRAFIEFYMIGDLKRMMFAIEERN